MTTTYDVIVIGLGVMGTAAAYHLSTAGKRVLGLEQFDIDHNKGSSHGESRIIRYAYSHPIYIEMARESFSLWRALEQASGKRLMFRTGGFDFGPTDSESLQLTRASLEAAHIPYEWLGPDEANRRFPQFRLSPGMAALYQADAAYLAASSCVLAMAELAHVQGADIVPNTPALEIEPINGLVRVHTPARMYEAPYCIITAGPWAGKVLGQMGHRLPVQPTREQIVFLDPLNPDLYNPDQCPIFIYHGVGAQRWFYGLPNVQGTGVKVGIHGNNDAVDPDNVRREGDQAYVHTVREWVEKYLPYANGPVKEVRTCLYTMTPDEHFIIDHLPDHPNIVYGAGFSGHGFKFGILIGKMLAEMATMGQTPYDRSLFRADRFQSSLKATS